jgi:predicted RNase H-like HicB family nuclease
LHSSQKEIKNNFKICLVHLVLPNNHSSDKFGIVASIKFYVYKEPPYYVAQCINVDVSSFGNSIEEAITNLEEAVALYLEEAVALYLEEPAGPLAYRLADEQTARSRIRGLFRRSPEVGWLTRRP